MHNEVTSSHPLVRRLEDFRASGRVRDIVLGPLVPSDLAELVAESLGTEIELGAPLARLVHEKTGGNPFFVIQFLRALADEQLLRFDHIRSRWSWDVEGIEAKRYTDNVVELLAAKLTKLPLQTRNALQQLACLGHVADVSMLSIVMGAGEEEVHRALWEARREQLVDRRGNSYAFVHDKVQEAAYALTPEESRAETHLAIGRLLVLSTSPEARDEAIFDIVGHLNRGAALLDSDQEREQLAELNLMAGKRAQSSVAYASALHYLRAGAELLSEAWWERRPELMFALQLHSAQCEFSTGDHAGAQTRLEALGSRAARLIDKSAVACLQIDVHMAASRPESALSVCFDYLRQLGIDWSLHPTDEEARREYDLTLSLLGQREIEELIELPLSDPEATATMEVLVKTLMPALFTDPNLFSLVVWRMASRSIELGNCEVSTQAYTAIGVVRGAWRAWMGDGAGAGNQAWYRLGRLGYELSERHGFQRFQAPTYLAYAQGVVSPTLGPRPARALIRRTFDAATASGDLTYACHAWHHLATNLLLAGAPLVEVQRDAEQGLDFARSVHFVHQFDVMRTILAHVLSLRGLTTPFGSMSIADFDEVDVEPRLSADPGLMYTEFRYCWHKLQARFFAGDYASAIDACRRQQRVPTLATPSEAAEAEFFGALSHAACCDAESNPSSAHAQEARAHHLQLLVWARDCPVFMESRVALVEAEIARFEGRESDAERNYEVAIKSARVGGLVQIEAMANELAAGFYGARGFDTTSNAYLREARECYLRWGADGKVRQLETRYPLLRERESVPSAQATIAVRSEQLDLATVVQVAQALSGEMRREKLIDALMRLAIQHAGAERGLLLLARGDELRPEAEAVTSGDATVVRGRAEAAGAHSASIVNYVRRSRSVVILDDAAAHPNHAADAHVRAQQAKSILCLPLINDDKVTGVLYLENNLAPSVFTPDRVTVLKVLAAQAAISLENSRLYHDLANREAKIQRLVDVNIWGICIWTLAGAVLEANGALLRLLQYERADIASGALRWTEMTPADWRESDEHALAQLRATGSCRPYEKEIFRRDGSRVPVMLGAALFEDGGDEGVAFVLDLTERKQSERALSKAQSELARASRVATLGALTASIAHEVNQPISGIITNASTCLRLLDADPPNLAAARMTAERTLRDGRRATEIIQRLRDMFSHKARTTERLDLNEVARELLKLTASELQRRGVSLRTDFQEALPAIAGDRIQLEQVILNLVINAADAMRTIEDRSRDLLVTTNYDTDRVRLSVRDSGIGIDRQNPQQLFEAFYTTKGTGMGIGLSISRSIIEEHGGTIWASNNDDHGATFAFSLPIAQE